MSLMATYCESHAGITALEFIVNLSYLFVSPKRTFGFSRRQYSNLLDAVASSATVMPIPAMFLP